MFLQTDEQTIDDLRLFPKRDQPGIMDIYNHTYTRGGEALMQEMFHHPLCDQEAIAGRAGIIAAFAAMNAKFPFEGAVLDMVEKYLLQGEEEVDGHKHTLGEKEIAGGVSAVIELLHKVREFVTGSELSRIPQLEEERKKIMDVLQHPALAPVFQDQPKSRLSFAAVTAYDVLIRAREKDKVLEVLQFIYQVDVFISVAHVATKRQFVFPVALPRESGKLKIEGVYHPELKQPVPNSLTMDRDNNVVFLTGANMAGKSTFLRSFSTAVYIAHMGFPVAASHMEFPVMDGIYTTINLPDNLGIGASHFYAEVLRVKKIATALNDGKALFVLFDELFRGTNVKDAHEGTVAITHAFADNHDSMFIISSHIVEAGDALKQKPNIGFCYLPTRMNGNVPEYTYKLEQGITDDRHGMIIIRNEGILETLKNGKKD